MKCCHLMAQYFVKNYDLKDFIDNTSVVMSHETNHGMEKRLNGNLKMLSTATKILLSRSLSVFPSQS